MIKQLILVKIRHLMDINMDLFQCFNTFFYKKASATSAIAVSVIKNENISKKELAENYTIQFLENLKYKSIVS